MSQIKSQTLHNGPQPASLFYLLANHRQVPLSKLVRALRYQTDRGPDLHLSFAQILIAFNDLHHNLLSQWRESQGELDEDPIGHLMVDLGYLAPEQLLHLRTQLAASGRSVGPLLNQSAQVLGPAMMLAELESIVAAEGSALALSQLRPKAMDLFRRQLLSSGLLDQEAFRVLGLQALDYVPLRFKPLLDALVLLGAWPDFLSPAVCVEAVPLQQEPLLRLLCSPGLVNVSVISRLMYLHDPVADTGVNPAVLLIRHSLLTRGYVMRPSQKSAC
ncbi:MAG: hypothetical protein CVV27_10820 [Candidatus Melainabacteria bacterium HGW-Melainabacteria-1]|nr:MAG: hypothetical protein CVV27_10820 [Candidatus Melainabacteria bacterium HGW-Melainabacteria-1]